VTSAGPELPEQFRGTDYTHTRCGRPLSEHRGPTTPEWCEFPALAGRLVEIGPVRRWRVLVLPLWLVERMEADQMSGVLASLRAELGGPDPVELHVNPEEHDDGPVLALAMCAVREL
jgi:hypothetical protein